MKQLIAHISSLIPNSTTGKDKASEDFNLMIEEAFGRDHSETIHKSLNEIDFPYVKENGKTSYPNYHNNTFKNALWLGFLLAKMSSRITVYRQCSECLKELPLKDNGKHHHSLTTPLLTGLNRFCSKECMAKYIRENLDLYGSLEGDLFNNYPNYDRADLIILLKNSGLEHYEIDQILPVHFQSEYTLVRVLNLEDNEFLANRAISHTQYNPLILLGIRTLLKNQLDLDIDSYERMLEALEHVEKVFSDCKLNDSLHEVKTDPTKAVDCFDCNLFLYTRLINSEKINNVDFAKLHAADQTVIKFGGDQMVYTEEEILKYIASGFKFAPDLKFTKEQVANILAYKFKHQSPSISAILTASIKYMNLPKE